MRTHLCIPLVSLEMVKFAMFLFRFHISISQMKYSLNKYYVLNHGFNDQSSHLSLIYWDILDLNFCLSSRLSFHGLLLAIAPIREVPQEALRAEGWELKAEMCFAGAGVWSDLQYRVCTFCDDYVFCFV